jgi:hypothetical protein
VKLNPPRLGANRWRIETGPANARRFCGKNGHLCELLWQVMGFAGDCVLTAQSKSEKSIHRGCSKKANKWEFSEILAHAGRLHL